MKRRIRCHRSSGHYFRRGADGFWYCLHCLEVRDRNGRPLLEPLPIKES